MDVSNGCTTEHGSANRTQRGRLKSMRSRSRSCKKRLVRPSVSYQTVGDAQRFALQLFLIEQATPAMLSLSHAQGTCSTRRIEAEVKTSRGKLYRRLARMQSRESLVGFRSMQTICISAPWPGRRLRKGSAVNTQRVGGCASLHLEGRRPRGRRRSKQPIGSGRCQRRAVTNAARRSMISIASQRSQAFQRCT